jgi:hypothetical protein
MRQCCHVGRCSCRGVASSAAPSIDPGWPSLLAVRRSSCERFEPTACGQSMSSVEFLGDVNSL